MATSTPASLAYRRVSSQNTSPVALVLALYDTLCGDLRRAAEAMRRSEIEERCRQLKHGFSVLTQLDTLLDVENGGDAARNLRSFYGHLRGEMLRAQFVLKPEVLDQAHRHVLEVREAWEIVQARELAPPPMEMAEMAAVTTSTAPAESMSFLA